MSSTIPTSGKIRGIAASLDADERSEYFAALGRQSALARTGGVVLSRDEVEAVREALDTLAGDPRWQRIWRRLLTAPASDGGASDAA